MILGRHFCKHIFTGNRHGKTGAVYMSGLRLSCYFIYSSYEKQGTCTDNAGTFLMEVKSTVYGDLDAAYTKENSLVYAAS